MGVPAAVKKQAEKARKAHAALLAPPATEKATHTASPPANNDAAAATKTVDSGKTDTPPPRQPIDDGIEAKKPDPLMDWETRYKNMRSKGDIRSKELETQLTAANDRIKGLEAKITELEGKVSSSTGREELMSSEEREFMGDEGSAVIERMQSQHRKEIEALTTKLDSLAQSQSKPAETGANSGTGDSFYEDLKATAPNWEKTNANKYFHAWLAQIDPHTGEPRQNDIDLAQAARNGRAVGIIVNRFEAEFADPSSAEQAASGASYEPDSTRGGGSPVILPNEIPEGFHVEYTGAEVKDFYNRKTKVTNRFREGRASKEEMDQLAIEEAEIRKAVAEGRVKN